MPIFTKKREGLTTRTGLIKELKIGDTIRLVFGGKEDKLEEKRREKTEERREEREIKIR